MADRSNFTAEQRERERAANRERMRRRYQNMPPEERSRIHRQRREREAAASPEVVALRKAQRSATMRRYIESRKGDAEFWRRRKEYLRRWRNECRLDEAFDVFMARIEVGAE